jgi:cell division protein FtsB
VSKLSHENIKIKTEMVILRDEHTEVLHNMFKLHKRNDELENENSELQNGDMTWGNNGS